MRDDDGAIYRHDRSPGVVVPKWAAKTHTPILPRTTATPIRHIKQWKTPALIIHGEKDYRCPIGEGLNLFEALQYHGVPSEMLVFPDENH